MPRNHYTIMLRNTFLKIVLAPCVALLGLPVSGLAQSYYTTPYAFSTLAGVASIGSADGLGPAARFWGAAGVAVDGVGNVYVADTLNHTIRKISSNGTVTTIAGAAGYWGTADGIARDARFNRPQGVAIDSLGNIYVADTGNHVIRKVSATGLVSTVAGTTGAAGYVDDTGTAARFNGPQSLTVDTGGNLYVADTGNGRIRKITPAGVVTTLVPQMGFFYQLSGIAVDAAGNVYVAGNAVHKVTPAGEVSVLVANVNARGITIDSTGQVYVYLNDDTIGKISPAGVLNTLAGTANQRGSTDGSGTAARFGAFLPSAPGSPLPPVLTISGSRGLAADSAGNIYVADTQNNTVRKITAAAVVSTLAGYGQSGVQGAVDGTGSTARFGNFFSSVAVGPAGELYAADTSNHTIRKISTGGTVGTFAGTAGQTGSADGTGSAARFSYPSGVAVDQTGTVYVADAGNRTIRKISPAAVVSTWAGAPGNPGIPTDGVGPAASFNAPRHLAITSSGIVFVGDNDRLRRITPDGSVTTVAGSQGKDIPPPEPFGLSYRELISGVAVDSSGNAYAIYQLYQISSHAIAFPLTATIKRFTPDGTVTIRAGTAGLVGSNDGPDSQAGYDQPQGMAVDAAGNIYFADSNNQLVRRISLAGEVSTLAGLAGVAGSEDGVGFAARFNDPSGLALDAGGRLYIVSSGTIRKGQVASGPLITTQPQSATVSAGGSVQFSVTATGAPDPTYQWYFNGNAFSGATGSMLSFTNARPADAGDYTVVVTNSLGSLTSAKAALTVNAVNPPPSSGGGGGGGAPSAWFVLTLLALGTVRRLSRR